MNVYKCIHRRIQIHKCIKIFPNVHPITLTAYIQMSVLPLWPLAGPRPRTGRKTFNDEDDDENEDEEGEEDDCGVLIGAVCIVYV